MPPHASLKGAQAGGEGRTFDDGCRGVGGSPLIPTTSAGGDLLCLRLQDKRTAKPSL